MYAYIYDLRHISIYPIQVSTPHYRIFTNIHPPYLHNPSCVCCWRNWRLHRHQNQHPTWWWCCAARHASGSSSEDRYVDPWLLVWFPGFVSLGWPGCSGACWRRIPWWWCRWWWWCQSRSCSSGFVGFVVCRSSSAWRGFLLRC